ncbi:MAG: ATP-binding cassette domain-containing protein, partial [Acidobacteriota bacterium]
SASTLNAAIDRGLRFQKLGELQVAGSTLPVVAGDRRDRPLADLELLREGRLIPLRAVADVELQSQEAPWVAHLGGVRGVVLLISREEQASPLALERSLRQVFDRFGLSGQVTFLIDEAAPLRLLLSRLALGFVVALLITVALAGLHLGRRAALWQALALPTGLAAGLNGLWLAGYALDVTTLPALAAGLGCALLFGALRLGKGAGPPLRHAVLFLASSLTLPVAVTLAGGRLAPLLAAPVQAFVISLVSAVAALWVLPRPELSYQPAGRVTAPLRWSLRNGATVLLGLGAVTYLLIVVSGSALVPRPGDLAPAIADLAISVRFAEGGTQQQAAAQIAGVERHLDATKEIESHWSVFNRRNGTVFASVRRDDRRLRELQPLALRLQAQLSSVGASARVSALAANSSGEDASARFSDSLDDEPETDEDATFYRFILRHTDFERLRQAHARVMDGVTRFEHAIWRDQIHSDWGKPTTRVELVPRPGVSRAEVTAATQAIALGSQLSSGRAMSAVHDLRLRVRDARAPRDLDEVPQRPDLLGLQTSTDGEPLVPATFFESREVLSAPSVRRQSGRFVVPVTLRLNGTIRPRRENHRVTVDRVLRQTPAPPGTSVELPELNPAIWDRQRLRMLAIAGTLPALLFALAACRLNAVGAGFAALLPPALGLLAASPIIQTSQGHVDEMTLVMVAAALVGCFPLVLESVSVSISPRSTTLAGGIVYRWLARRAIGVVIAVVPLVALLAGPGIGLDNDRYPWVLPMRAAAVATATACLVSLLGLPVLMRALARRRGLASQLRQLARPAAWVAPVEHVAPVKDVAPGEDVALEEAIAPLAAAREAQASAAPVTQEHAASPGSGALELRARNLSKIYGDGFQALHAVDFRLEPGIVGLLGPNGAGKTTLLRLLCGLLEPTRGQVQFRGVPLSPLNLPEYRSRVGFLPQGFNAYEGFTGADFLDYWAIERGVRDPKERRREVERALAEVGLEDAANRKVRDFSGGMRRRIGIARTLLGAPPIVIVDEPTTGLDVQSRNRLRETLLSVAGERIILFSTHIASDVAAAASRILLLNHGRLVFDGPSTGLIDLARGRVFEALIEDHDLQQFSSRFRVTTRVRTLEGLRVRAVAYGDQQPAGDLVEPNLEEAYLAMIGAPGEQKSLAEAGDFGSLLDLSVWDSRRKNR